MKHTAASGDEGEPWLPFGRKSENQSSRRATSDEAYARAPMSEQRAALLEIIRRSPHTCDEIMETGWAHQTASAGINWLMRKGYIVDSGFRRKTRMRRNAIVWAYAVNPKPIKLHRPTRSELEQQNTMLTVRITQLETELTGWRNAHHNDNEFDGAAE